MVQSSAWPAKAVILGVEGERTQGFCAALEAAGHAPAQVLDYRAFIEDSRHLGAMLEVGPCLLRFDSPGGDFELWRTLARLGGEEMAALGETALDAEALARLSLDPGSILAPRQFHLGLMRALKLARSLASKDTLLLNDVDAIGLFFDKAACHAFMERNGFPVPRGLGPAASFEALAGAMSRAGIARAFVKQRYGSGAAGVAALAVSRFGVRAWSPAELVRQGGETRLYSTKRVRQYDGREAVALIDAICTLDAPLGAHAEQWVPKAAIDGRSCDLRVLAIAGEPAHTVLRMSRSPITNLDLRNRRAPSDLLRQKIPAAVWDALIEDCRKFAALFPKALQVSLDAGIAANLKRHVFFEANAFGDLLRRVTHRGQNPYEAQVAALPRWAARAGSPVWYGATA
jgi:hypothetical protein